MLTLRVGNCTKSGLIEDTRIFEHTFLELSTSIATEQHFVMMQAVACPSAL
jgi:hypothetical protein